MRILIAILTCARYLDRRNAIRETWMPFVERLNDNVTVKFFSGKEPCLADDAVGDIVHLYCPDSYPELVQKTSRLIEYALANGFDRLIKVDDDTFFEALPEYIAALTAHDYLGNVRQHPEHNGFTDYAQGGCYSLSRKAMEAVVARGLPLIGIEDGEVGKALLVANIIPVNEPRIKTHYRHGIPRMGSDVIAAHTCTPQVLHDIYDGVQIELLARYNDVLNKQNEIGEVKLVDAAPSGDEAVTIVVQSCGRMDLLQRTLKSLSQCVIDYPIRETIIYEDGSTRRPDWLLEYRTLGLGEIRWIAGGQRVGQWMACDRLLDEVKTEYILRVEDDFEFLPDKPGFLAHSIDILKRYPKVIQVSLRGSDTTSGHPIVDDPSYPEFKIQERYWREFWGAWSGNNHIARLSDWKKIGSYGRVIGYGKQAIFGERTISKLYLDLSYSIAVLPDGPYIKHIGDRRSKAIDKLPAKPKVLIAVPACFKYAYGSHANDLKVGARQTEGRVEAVRATWWNDIKPFSDYVDAKFFYGKPLNRKLQPDEVALNVEDDYEHLPHKMRAIYRWAIEHGYQYVFKADDDGYLYIDRLLRTDYEQWDQMGFSNCTHGLKNTCNCYITGGAGYFLSKRAMVAVVNEPISHWAEDLTTGKALRGKGYRRTGHPGFLPGFEKHYVDVDEVLKNDKVVACHAVTPEGMRKLYDR